MDFLAAVENEIDALERSLREKPDPRLVKLHELQRVRAIYRGEAIAQASTPLPRERVSEPGTKRQFGRRPSPERQRAIDAAKEILAGETEPMKTSALFRRITERGIEIAGQNPSNNLSAMLYHAKEFTSHGRAGWTLAKQAENEKPADDAPGEVASTGLFSDPAQGREAGPGGGA